LLVHAVLFGKKLGQRRTFAKSTKALNQRPIDVCPRFTWSFSDRTRLPCGPLPRSYTVGIGPSKNPVHGQLGKILDVSHTAMFGEQFG
jgi:hypothetical protein